MRRVHFFPTCKTTNPRNRHRIGTKQLIPWDPYLIYCSSCISSPSPSAPLSLPAHPSYSAPFSCSLILLSSCVLYLSPLPSSCLLLPSSFLQSPPSCSVPSCSPLSTSSPLLLSYFLPAHFLFCFPYSYSNDFYPISEEGPVNADKGIARTSQGKEGSLATTAVDVR